MILNKDWLINYKLNNQKINIINIDYKPLNDIRKNRINTNMFIKECFDTAFKILKSGYSNKLINGPVNKSKFLDKKFLGLTEYISKQFKIDNTAMLIYSKDLSFVL